MSEFKLTSVLPHFNASSFTMPRICQLPKIRPNALLEKMGPYLVLPNTVLNLWLISQKLIQPFEEQFNLVCKRNKLPGYREKRIAP